MKSSKREKNEHGPRHVTPAGRSVFHDLFDAEEGTVPVKQIAIRSRNRLRSHRPSQVPAWKASPNRRLVIGAVFAAGEPFRALCLRPRSSETLRQSLDRAGRCWSLRRRERHTCREQCHFKQPRPVGLITASGDRIAHIFIAFLAYCLHVTLGHRLKNLAPGLTSAQRVGEVLRRADARCTRADHRWTRAHSHALHTARARTEAAVGATEVRSTATPPPRLPGRLRHPCSADLGGGILANQYLSLGLRSTPRIREEGLSPAAQWVSWVSASPVCGTRGLGPWPQVSSTGLPFTRLQPDPCA
jgi:hypothetical protein